MANILAGKIMKVEASWDCVMFDIDKTMPSVHHAHMEEIVKFMDILDSHRQEIINDI